MANFKKYDDFTVTQLTQETRNRGLDKPVVSDIGAWAAWLREQDMLPVVEPQKSSAKSKSTADKKDI